MKTLGAIAAILVLAAATNSDAAMLEPGQDFPAWALKDDTGATVTSKDLAGKTYLLWFYPKAMTSGCTAEGRGLRDRSDELTKLQLTILGVSFDDPATNAEFVRKEGFPFRLLSDEDHALATQVGAAWISFQPISWRVSYLVGPDGKVLKAYDSVDPAEHAAEVERDVRALAK